jgi:uncharacterized surface protein with fasciclin (FAS1) repeats
MTFDQFSVSSGRWWTGLCTGLLAVALVLAGCDSNGTVEPEPAPGGPTTLADVVANTDNLSTLATALDQAGKVETLGDTTSTFTVFAPSDDAFSAYDVDFLVNNAGLLGEVLDYHVVAGQALESDELEDGQTVETVQGDQLEVTVDGDGNVFIEGAPVTTADVRTDNGIAHIVGDVLLTNRTAAERVQVTSATSTLNAALGASAGNQADALNDTTQTFTVFAPSNAAFGPYDVDFLTSNAGLLSDVLDYHVVAGAAVTSGDLEEGTQTFETVTGDEVEVTVDGDGNVFVEGAPVTAADIEASNAAIHLVGDVLLTNRTAQERLQVTTAFDPLYATLQDVGLASAFGNSNNTWTTFAPDTTAFQNADLSGYSDAEIQEILQYHTLDGVTDSEALLETLENNDGQVSLETNQGENVTITERDDGSIVFNDGEATLNLDRVDQRASNGILHRIDGVLIPPSFTRSVSYDLAAQSNDGAISSGVNGTVTFWEINENQTAVTLELDEGATGASVAHPAHIHENSASEGGSISIYLTPIDGSGGGGTSARIVERPFDELANFDGYVNIHESVSNLGTVVAQGNIGANASGTLAAGLDLVDDRRSTRYTLDANSNSGSVAADGIPGSVTFIELTSDVTYVQTSLEPSPGNGATGASVSHPAHIHNGVAGSGGGIEYYLSPIDGSDSEARAGKLVEASYDDLTTFSGYVNVHESVSNLGDVVSQGNIGANAAN